MKRVVLGVGMCVALVAGAAAQGPKYGVTVTAEKNVDFAKFMTYSWTAGQPSADKKIDAQIIAAVDRELSGLGMTKATSGPGDVLATYYSVSRTDVNLKAKPDSSGTQPQYTVGTLMVALLEPGSRRRLLRLRVDQPIETEPAQLEASINSAVAALFAQYPTRRRK
jgi:Domain of unknown function (DUF4136)